VLKKYTETGFSDGTFADVSVAEDGAGAGARATAPTPHGPAGGAPVALGGSLSPGGATATPGGLKPTPGSPGPEDVIQSLAMALQSSTKATVVVSGLRAHIAEHPQGYYSALPLSFGPTAIAPVAWEQVVANAPMSESAVKLLPPANPTVLSKVIVDVSKDMASYPQRRNHLLEQLTYILCSGAAMAYLEAPSGTLGAYVAAVRSGNHQLANVVKQVTHLVAALRDEAPVLVRIDAPTKVVEHFVSSLDQLFKPSTQSSYLQWADANPQAGETGLLYYKRLQGLQATLGMSARDLDQRFRSALFTRGMLGAQIAETYSALSDPLTGVADLTRLRESPIFSTVPIVKTAIAPRPAAVAERPSGVAAAGLTLATMAKSPAQAHDLSLFFKIAMEKAGLDLGPVPPCAVAKACALCDLAGYVLKGPYSEEAKDAIDRSANEVWDHNPWRCGRVKKAAAVVMSKCDGLQESDLIRIIDNPRDVARALAASK
jgi:hypothetical protein